MVPKMTLSRWIPYSGVRPEPKNGHYQNPFLSSNFYPITTVEVIWYHFYPCLPLMGPKMTSSRNVKNRRNSVFLVSPILLDAGPFTDIGSFEIMIILSESLLFSKDVDKVAHNKDNQCINCKIESKTMQLGCHHFAPFCTWEYAHSRPMCRAKYARHIIFCARIVFSMVILVSIEPPSTRFWKTSLSWILLV